MLTQGGARGHGGSKLLPSLALGYLLMPLQGSQDEAAASFLPLHFLKSVQDLSIVRVRPSSLGPLTTFNASPAPIILTVQLDWTSRPEVSVHWVS